MITLYQFGNSVCCQKVRVTLAEKQLEWEAREIDLFTNQQYDPDYLKLNPAGVVPTLVHNGEVVVESTLICEYLDETFPEPPLLPRAPAAKARARLWAKMVDEGLFEGVGAISFAAMFRERMRAMTPGQREARFNNPDRKRGDQFRETYQHGAKARHVVYAVGVYERAFSRLEATLADGRSWIMGDAATLADISLMPYVARLDYLGVLDLWIADHANVKAWWLRVLDWPSFRAGIADPMIPSEMEEMNHWGPTIRGDLLELLADKGGSQ